ncbi:MAG TPA: hypothetical protein VGE70_09640 [Burkholderiaceae bacterium]
MTVEPSLLTPQQRLARNRQHILAQMRGSHGGQDDAADAASPPGDGARSSGTWSVLRRSLRAWWRAHPARLVGRQVGRIAEPALHDLAREQPVRLIALAAGAGAAAALLRPWRLLSLGAVVALALRPVDLPSLLVALVAPAADAPGEEQRHG